MRLAIAFVLLVLGCVPALAAGSGLPNAPGHPYVLSDTEVLPFKTEDKTRDYVLFVSLPRNYATRTSERFPTIYLLDADYSFAIARNVMRHFSDRNQIGESIIVGIGDPGADADLDIYKRLRVKDYTPAVSIGASGYGDDIDKQGGGATTFLHILGDEIVPAIDKRYRTDPAARMIVGHSYGGLFATWTMFQRPGLFRDYLVVSPSLWFNNRMVFDVMHAYLATHKELPARVFFSVGSFEGGGSMAADIKALDGELTAAHPAGYESEVHVFDGETHNSVFPSAFTRGVRVLYGYKGESGPVVAPGSKPK